MTELNRSAGYGFLAAATALLMDMVHVASLVGGHRRWGAGYVLAYGALIALAGAGSAVGSWHGWPAMLWVSALMLAGIGYYFIFWIGFPLLVAAGLTAKAAAGAETAGRAWGPGRRPSAPR